MSKESNLINLKHHFVGYLDNTNDRLELEQDWGHIQFQHGPAKENGENGLGFDSFILFAKMRLQYLNRLHYSKENEEAIEHLDAVHNLMVKRYKDRESRGVEGKDED